MKKNIHFIIYSKITFDVGALIVGGVSIATILAAKFKFYVKKNGSLNWGCGFSDKPLIDDDEIEVKTLELGDVHVMYVKNKHSKTPTHECEESNEESDEESEDKQIR